MPASLDRADRHAADLRRQPDHQLFQLKFHTQRNDLISPTKEYFQRWQQYIAEFGDDDDMVVVVEGNDRQHMELALEDLAQQVADKPELFDRLFYKVDLRSLSNRVAAVSPCRGRFAQIQDSLKDMSLCCERLIGAVDRTSAGNC